MTYEKREDFVEGLVKGRYGCFCSQLWASAWYLHVCDCPVKTCHVLIGESFATMRAHAHGSDERRHEDTVQDDRYVCNALIGDKFNHTNIVKTSNFLIHQDVLIYTMSPTVGKTNLISRRCDITNIHPLLLGLA